MKQLRFDRKAQYGLYLRDTLSHSLKPDSFNIFLHCVTNAYPHTYKPISEKEDVLAKVDSILTTGLDLEGNHERCPYGSINGTAKFMGSAQDLDIENVVNYHFTNTSRYVNTIILAIPKYIELSNGEFEFSSYNGQMKDFNRFTKACLLDISSERHLPTEFIFGYQLVDRQTNTVKFWKNDGHFSQLPPEAQAEIMKGFAEKIQAVINYCKTYHNSRTFEDVFDVMTRQHLALLEDYFNEV